MNEEPSAEELKGRIDKAANHLKMLDSIATGLFKNYSKAMGKNLELVTAEIRKDLGISEEEKGK